MDLLSDIFKSIRLQGSVFFDSALSAPWELRIEPSNRPKFHIVVEGFTWIQCPTTPEPICLRAGNALFLNEDRGHSVVDSPTGDKGTRRASRFVQENKCRLICGTFGFDDDMRHPIIDSLPQRIHVPIPEEQRSLWALVRSMTGELNTLQAGSTLIVDRLCEMLLIYVLRAHADKNPQTAGFSAALGDPVTRTSLILIHQCPEKNWTLESLAKASGLSRSAFAARFNQLVGVPPKAYLTTWRMHRARTLLQSPTARVSAVARQVGYTSDTAFIRAFRQFYNKSPGSFRADART